MSISVVFPKFNLEKSSGEVSRWLVSVGDEVTEGQVLFEVEDDKASVEVDATANGFIGSLMEEGVEIDVGTVVAQIFETKEAAEQATNAAALGASIPGETSEPTATAATPAQPAAIQPSARTESGKVPSTPLARRMARENGISLEGMSGSGPRGRIQRKDVQAAINAGPASVSASTAPAIATATATAPTTVPYVPYVPGNLLHSTWFNRGSGTPVVFIHGFGGESASWNPMLSGARVAWSALGVDLPGHGQSPLGLPDDLDGIAADVETTLLAQGIDQAMLVGHSFGGAVAARIASRGNIRVSAQCLFAPAGLSPQIEPSFITGMCRARSRESLRPWLEMLVEDTSLISNAFVDYTLVGRASDDKFNAIRQFADRYMPDQTPRENVLGDLAQASGPIRIVFGRQDRVLPVSATRNVPGNVAVHLWDKCGHMPQFEHRKDALSIIEEVYRSC